jgi:CubicO group peptidase (beta-lactamase class C family)
MLSIFIMACGSDMPLETIFPVQTWVVSNPEKLGIDAVKLDSALAYLESKSFEDGIEEVMVIVKGRVIYQGDSTYKSHNIYSCSKGFTSTVLGLLIDQGKLELDQKVVDYLPGLKALYPQVTFRQFTTMTSGFSAVGRSLWNDENADWSWTPYNPDTAHFEPGTQFEYWDEAQMTFGKALTAVLQEPMIEFLRREVTDRIGMGPWKWITEQQINGIDINNGCTGVHVNARQLARFGHLFLNRGNWSGQQIISEEWCKMATTNQVNVNIPVYPGDRSNSRGSGSYGFNWWFNSENGLSRMPDAPLGVAYLSGLNHNICCIIPEWDMVIIRMGDDKNPPEGKYVVWNHFLRLVGNSRIRE